MSLDEARSGFRIDAGNTLVTTNYLLVGDNAYSYSTLGTNLSTGFIGDIDTYFTVLQRGHNYTVTIAEGGIIGTPPTDADFGLIDRYGNIITLSSDYGNYSSYTFTATDTLYYVQVYTSTPGHTTLRLADNTITESNGIGELIYAGRAYTAALDYVSDVDIYYYYAVAGQSYDFGIRSNINDIYFDLEYSQLRIDNLISNGSGNYTFTAPYTGNYELHISSNSFSGIGTYTLLTDITPPEISTNSSDTYLTSGETSKITFIFSEPVIDFTISDILVTGGVLSAFKGQGLTYEVTFTPNIASNSIGKVSVASGKFSDVAGNVNNDGANANNSVVIAINTKTNTNPTVTGTEMSEMFFYCNWQRLDQW